MKFMIMIIIYDKYFLLTTRKDLDKIQHYKTDLLTWIKVQISSNTGRS